ncbi:UNVERIFIED_CONTAM: hypothetical protein Scaly_0190000 [Sesamum calycinum]|uniref:Uncharacterized protein n=1 Tax=Sesamum calycinum TaxID=2727403 RepID=A0AAW2SXH7_9LAMI
MGDWVDDGYGGVETWARGSRYRGQYRQGLRHGFGVYRFYTGDVYAGEWSSGQSHGCGIHTCEDGRMGIGMLENILLIRCMDLESIASQMATATRVHGMRVEDRGLGCTFRNGETQSGHWQNGVLDVPSTQSNTYPVSPVAVNHSKVLNVVQEARRAAEKAYEVTKVDERVNRAVAAANRAANAARVAAVKAVQKQMHHRSNSDEIPIPVV